MGGLGQFQLIIHYFLLFTVAYLIFKLRVLDPGKPASERIEKQVEEGEEQRRLCKQCHVYKPKRCHHCRRCNHCVLRMNQHCSWTNSCIGLKNYKTFFNLIFYCSKIGFDILDLLFIDYSRQYYFDELNFENLGAIAPYFQIFMRLICSVLTIIALVYLGFNLRLISKNQTTVEFIEKKPGNYDKGLLKNFREFLGPGLWIWPFY